MRTAKNILVEVLALPPGAQRRIVKALQESSARKENGRPPHKRGRYARTLALAGTFHSDFRNVSTDTDRHLADIAHAERDG